MNRPVAPSSTSTLAADPRPQRCRALSGTRIVLGCIALAALASMGCDDAETQNPPSTDATAVDSEAGDGTSATASPDGSTDTGSDPADTCTPACAGAVCGDDGCGGTCGACGTEQTCTAGACIVTECPANCGDACPQGCFDPGACTAAADALDIRANIETIGVVATLAATAEPVRIYYRTPGAVGWFRGHDATRIPDGRWATSLFWLTPSTEYEVAVIADGERACARVRTLPSMPEHTPSQRLVVDASVGPDGDGSAANPFSTIQAALDVATPGTDIDVLPGLYREALVLRRSGERGAYLRIVGQPGAILDGSSPETPSWTKESESVWRTPWTGSPTYLNRDGQRVYHYLSLADLQAGLGDDGEPIAEGFFVDDGQLWVKTSTDPTQATWQIPVLGTGIGLDGVTHVWVEGLEIRYFGDGEYPKGIDVRASDSVVLVGNHIHATPSPIWVRRGSADVRIHDNRIHQTSVATWPWPAVKGTDHENSAITLAGGRGAIVSDNEIWGIFNGIGSGSFSNDGDTSIAYDVDVYRNRLLQTSDDGLEPEGACINNRFWANLVDRPHNGISLAPITSGPVWVVRNRFVDYAAGGFKVSNDSSGRVWLYHNTLFTDRPDTNGMSPSGPFTNMVFRNNIVRGTRYAFEDGAGTLENDFDSDIFFTSRGAPVIKWDDVRYDSVEAWCAATGQECAGSGADPMLIDPPGGRWAPRAASPAVDAGAPILGINDGFSGAAPDIGYVEAESVEVPPLVP